MKKGDRMECYKHYRYATK